MRKHFRIVEVVYRCGETAYVIERCLFGFWWVRQRVPMIYFDFPKNWWRGVSVFDTVDDAQDALYSHLLPRYPSSEYTLHVWRSRWLRG